MTPEFWAIVGVGVALGVLMFYLFSSLDRRLSTVSSDVAALRERMAKLEGAMDGFIAGQRGLLDQKGH